MVSVAAQAFRDIVAAPLSSRFIERKYAGTALTSSFPFT